MKNGIIALLSCCCLFLLLQTLGAFDFGSPFDIPEQRRHAEQRQQHVRSAASFQIAIPHDSSPLTQSCLQGIALAADILNQHGGILGKKIQLRFTQRADSIPAYNAALQAFCDDPAVAVAVGPFISDVVPSARALSQFAGLPLVSPLVVRADSLPPLSPDTFMTFFPPSERWAALLADALEAGGYRSVLLIGPEKGSYGELFCTGIERAGLSRPAFPQTYRLNYQRPLRPQDVVRALREYEGTAFDAVVFGGGARDFSILCSVLQERKLRLPVYVSDQIKAESLRTPLFPLHVPRLSLPEPVPGFNDIWQQFHGSEPDYYATLGALTLFRLADALRTPDDYNPQTLSESLRQTPVPASLVLDLKE